jgi:oxygen-dependent protoporphyrinogen oxidase
VLVEASDRLGGKIRTDRVDGALIEAGADWFITQRDEAIELCKEVGLKDDLVPPAVGGVQVWSGGRMRPWPPGFVRGIPSSARHVLRCDLLSPVGRMRALTDLAWPRRLAGSDTSIGGFVRRRFGREVLERLVDPMLAASRSGAAVDMSLAAGAPEIDAAARSHRSVMRALGKAPGGDVGFLGVRGGMQRLVDALRAGLSRADVRTNTTAVGLSGAGDGYTLELMDGAAIAATGVVLTVPAFAAAALVGGVSPVAAEVLRTIDYAPAVVVGLVYDPGDVPTPPGASGFLVPSSDRGLLTACAWFSSKWPHAAPPDGGAVIRCFAGERALGLADAELVEGVHDELEAAVGLRATPRATHIVRWERALPVYAVGHLDRVRAARRALAAHPRLAIAGAGYEASGLPACIAQGQQAARRVVVGASGAGRRR